MGETAEEFNGFPRLLPKVGDNKGRRMRRAGEQMPRSVRSSVALRAEI